MRTAPVCLWILVAAARPALGFDGGAGARAAGMADAFVAVADDANAVVANPAGLARLNGIHATMQHTRLLSGLSDGARIAANEARYAQPLREGRWGGVGLTYRHFQGAAYFTERTVSVGYGRAAAPGAFGFPGQWSGGAAIKRFQRDYDPGIYPIALDDSGVATGRRDPLFSSHGYGVVAYLVDVGALYRFGAGRRYGAGVAVTNVNRADLSLAGDGDKAPAVAKAGFSARYRAALVSAELRRARRSGAAGETDIALGGERLFSLAGAGLLAVRGGYAQGSRRFQKATAGVSFAWTQVRFDYAFDIPIGNLADLSGSHRVDVSFRFNPSAAAATLSTAPAQPRAVAAAATRPDAPDFAAALNYYVKRKAEGASIGERLALLLALGSLPSPSNAELSWLAKELSSL